MTDNNSKRFFVPRGWRVRYDYHVKPRGTSAILLNEHGVVRSVGFAKFNPHDEGFNAATGRSIALGRALAKLPRHLTRDPQKFGRDLGRDLLRIAEEGVNHDRLLARDPSRSLADELF